MITLYNKTTRSVICSRSLMLDDNLVFKRGSKYIMNFDINNDERVSLIDECGENYNFSALVSGSCNNMHFHVDEFFRELNPKKKELLSIYED